ncbi:DoxX family protein [Mucilaginibacter myungsuensis]|uniref:DoxX family protein n=1 Tax=Mucilaginibacter myungsuensis TaxID=649104 RepID=A0A929KYG0_9SPHI|nr:DoxX family protein [Mucilaginibacter myungsuensis]MBE9663984.1 DoxX family protein [Mucilaginibacter myungsuensis]MDN3601163.1 DoxX family protein [Mucilaginibacter myungsuensis]
MKKINIIYWIATVLLIMLMGSSGVMNAMNDPGSQYTLTKVMHYPEYFGRFIGIAKILGSIALLIPGFPKIKEWVYAGFTFDLIGATWSFAALGEPIKKIAPMGLFFVILIVSYIYYRKRVAAKDPVLAV